MTPQLTDAEIEQRATQFYEQELRATLEAAHRDEFVAIEPVSKTWYVGRSLREAARLARLAHPGRLSYVIRIGHSAALQIGGFDG